MSSIGAEAPFGGGSIVADPAIHVTMVTLGVADLVVSTAFYERLGLKAAGASTETVTFFDMGGLALGLFGHDALADDAGVAAETAKFRGAALAWNLPNEEAVDAAFARAIAAGGRATKPPEKVFWGGYSGYFADPDGHLWEIAYNPFAPLRANGAMEIS